MLDLFPMHHEEWVNGYKFDWKKALLIVLISTMVAAGKKVYRRVRGKCLTSQKTHKFCGERKGKCS